MDISVYFCLSYLPSVFSFLPSIFVPNIDFLAMGGLLFIVFSMQVSFIPFGSGTLDLRWNTFPSNN